MFLGIDAGSTTVKLVLCDRAGNLFRPFYAPNAGNPVPLVRDYLQKLYAAYPKLKIAGSAVTGYGEELIRNAFSVDLGIVETVAHYTAAKNSAPTSISFSTSAGRTSNASRSATARSTTSI